MSNHERHPHLPYWKKAHRDWRLWAAVILMLVAMIVYLASGDLAWRPRTPAPATAGEGVPSP